MLGVEGQEMIIDLSGWNEYKYDGFPQTEIPSDVELQLIQLTTCDVFKIKSEAIFPGGMTPSLDTFKATIFWRIKK
jgi:hypothetical protein